MTNIFSVDVCVLIKRCLFYFVSIIGIAYAIVRSARTQPIEMSYAAKANGIGYTSGFV